MGKFSFNPLTGEFCMNPPMYDEVLNEVFPLTVTLTKSPNVTTVEHTDASTSVVVTWTCKRKGENKNPSQVDIKYNGKSYGSWTNPPYNTANSQRIAINAKGTSTITATVTADGITKTATTSVTRILPLFIGFSSQGVLSAIKNNLAKHVKTSWNGETLNLDNPKEGSFLVIALPDGKTIKNITSGGFAVPLAAACADNSYKVLGVAYTYNVYYSANPIAAGTMSNLVITI